MARTKNGNGGVRVYERSGRFWGDFRRFEDVGGRREPLCEPGRTVATEDADRAQILAGRRLEELLRARDVRTLTGRRRLAGLEEYAAHHLVLKSGERDPKTVATAERHLQRLCNFLGPDTELGQITAPDLVRWVSHLRTLDNGRGGTLSEVTIRKHLNDASNLFGRAVSEGVLLVNPASQMFRGSKPSGHRKGERDFLEVADAALVLEAARLYRPSRPYQGVPYLEALLGTFLLTGGRRSEVLGLRVRDVSFDRSTVTIRPTETRRLKTPGSHREVPLWPQLRELLETHIRDHDRSDSEALLFPAPSNNRVDRKGERRLDNIRHALDGLAELLGDRVRIQPGDRHLHLRLTVFRHTYCAARLQTYDGLDPKGTPVPVTPWAVGRELGHTSTKLVEAVYGHVGRVRHRASEVAYRVEDHTDVLGERLVSLRESCQGPSGS